MRDKGWNPAHLTPNRKNRSHYTLRAVQALKIKPCQYVSFKVLILKFWLLKIGFLYNKTTNDSNNLQDFFEICILIGQRFLRNLHRKPLNIYKTTIMGSKYNG